MFSNRIDAGERLANALLSYKNLKEAIVIAIPRGGVVLGNIIAQKLQLPLELMLVKKIGHPSNSEFAIGAVNMRGYILDKYIDVSKEYINQEVDKIQKQLKKRYNEYYETRTPMDLKNKTVIIVDDGVATGNTLIASIKLAQREHPKEIIVAVPVGAKEAIKDISNAVDQVVCLESYSPFYAIGNYYQDFSQVTDQEVKHLLMGVSAWNLTAPNN